MALVNDVGFFICSICGEQLQEDDTSDETKANQAKQARLMSQLHPIIDTLRKIDDTFIPDNTFESSMNEARPPPTRVSQFSNGPSNGHNGHVENNMGGLKNYGNNSTASLVTGNINSSLQVNITSKLETAALEKQAQEAKAKALAQNALPTWHLESTVGKSMYAGADDHTLDLPKVSNGADIPGSGNINNAAVEEKKEFGSIGSATGLNQPGPGASSVPKNEDADSINAYFAKLQQDRDDEEEEEEDDEEEDAEFEDIVPEVSKPASKDEGEDDDDDDDFEDV